MNTSITIISSMSGAMGSRVLRTVSIPHATDLVLMTLHMHPERQRKVQITALGVTETRVVLRFPSTRPSRAVLTVPSARRVRVVVTVASMWEVTQVTTKPKRARTAGMISTRQSKAVSLLMAVLIKSVF
uniref:Uncharacterized protein n=1 Tax=Molossus molossus TaxID=27622 RepID=A0A7J8C8N0_MOLMO|nr:hypothetical protein HJG59_009898 [Molossus molossus]